MSTPTESSFDQSLHLAQKHFAEGRLAEADEWCRHVLRTVPNNCSALRLLANIATKVRRTDIAIQCLTRCTAAEPRNTDLQMELGNALMDAGRAAEAIGAYRIAVTLSPQSESVHSNLGIALHETQDLPQAVFHFRKAAQINPTSAVALNNLGHALKAQGQLTEAIAVLRKAIALKPTLSQAYINLANAIESVGDADQAFSLYEQAMAAANPSPNLHSAMALTSLYLPNMSQERIFAIHQDWNRQYGQPFEKVFIPHKNDRTPTRRLRIGYVSADFREHPVAYFFEPLLAGHDTSSYEVYCYGDLLRRPSQTTDRLRSLARHWRNITGMGDIQVAQMIREDQIDILVDLSGHTAGNRLLVFAQKPAPVQFTYLGYPATTGLTTIDYRITDQYADPPGLSDRYHSEKLIRLPNTFLCYRPPESAPPIDALPALKNKAITFGSFNRLSKINPELIDLWTRILSDMPNSKMVFKAAGLSDPTTRTRLLNQFAASGILAERITFYDKAPSIGGHMELLGSVDIALDSFPYHGTTTTCETLWMGVPVVTLAGQSHVSRVGVSILTNLGLHQLIASNAQEFLHIVKNLAGNISALGELRHTMRNRMQSSSLMDGALRARNVEAIYRAAWDNWCRSG